MKIISVQDISCYGNCSLTVALPILTYYGLETIILPSAVLSTHTGGFKDFTVHDLTDEMAKIISHWESFDLKVNALYTGYISNARQFAIIKEIKNKLLAQDALFFVDPAMADNGKMYFGLGTDIINGMRDLCTNADYIMPNITEACFLTDTEYLENYDEAYIDMLLNKLYLLGAKNIILTGVIKDNLIGAAYYDGKRKEVILREREEKVYHGTGDIFSAVFIANILNQKDPKEAISMACQFVIEAIKMTKKDQTHEYGCKIEEVLALKKF